MASKGSEEARSPVALHEDEEHDETQSVGQQSSKSLSIDMDQLRAMMEDVMDSKLKMLARKDPDAAQSFRSSMEDVLEEHVSSRPTSANYGRKGLKSTSSQNGYQSEGSPRTAGSPKQLGVGYFSSSSALDHALTIEEGSTIDFPATYDCDPRSWILAAGRLEKKRDGSWKAGWAKRFFVLSSSTLWYFLLPKRGVKGDAASLLGDYRGHIRVVDIKSMKAEDDLITLQCGDIKKNSVTQSSNRNITLKAASPELAEKWIDLLRSAHTALLQAGDKYKVGAGKPIDGYVANHPFSEREARAESIHEVDDFDDILMRVVNEKVLPIVDDAEKVIHIDGDRAAHIDPYLALVCLVCVNAICYMGPALNDSWLWMLTNAVFLGYVVYYEKLAGEHDAALYKYRRSVKALNTKLDRIGQFLREPDAALRRFSEHAFQVPEEIEKETLGNAFVASPPSTAASSSSFGAAEISVSHLTESFKERRAAVLTEISSVKTTTQYEKPTGGELVPSFNDEEDQNPTRFCWSTCDANFFNVRQIGYKTNHEKAPSAPSLYDFVGMDLLKDKSRLEGIHRYIKLPPPREFDDLDLIRKSGLPRILVVNILVPMKSPSMFGADDPGVSVVFYFAIRPETARAAAENEDRADVLLFKRFCTEFEYNDDIRRRFKGIGVAHNIKDLRIPQRIHYLNGKPVILYKTAVVQRFQDEFGPCFEVSVLVHKFNVVARTLFGQFRDMAREIKIGFAFLVQAEDDFELPECILGCGKIYNLDFKQATPILQLQQKSN